MRLTHSSIQVAAALMTGTRETRHYGYAISAETGLKGGVVYPLLRKMDARGWLDSDWEPVGELAEEGGRPPRRYYEVTDDGYEALAEMVRRARADTRFAQYRRPLRAANLARFRPAEQA